jgi:hypothetical protein
MLVLFYNDLETIITTLELEEQTIQTYFKSGNKNINDYTRAIWIPRKKCPTITVKTIGDALCVI